MRRLSFNKSSRPSKSGIDSGILKMGGQKSGKVETIFMEILGYEQYFQEDLNEAITEFKISECDSRFFGMKYEELVVEYNTNYSVN